MELNNNREPIVAVIKAIGIGSRTSDMIKLCLYDGETGNAINIALPLYVYKEVPDIEFSKVGLEKSFFDEEIPPLDSSSFKRVLDFLEPESRKLLFNQKQEFFILRNYCLRMEFEGFERIQPIYLNNKVLSCSTSFKEANFYSIFNIAEEDNDPLVSQAKKRLALYKRLNGLSVSTRFGMVRLIKPDYLVAPNEVKDFWNEGRMDYLKQYRVVYSHIADFTFHSYKLDSSTLLRDCFPLQRIGMSFNPMEVNKGRYSIVEWSTRDIKSDSSLMTLKKVKIPQDKFNLEESVEDEVKEEKVLPPVCPSSDLLELNTSFKEFITTRVFRDEKLIPPTLYIDEKHHSYSYSQYSNTRAILVCSHKNDTNTGFTNSILPYLYLPGWNKECFVLANSRSKAFVSLYKCLIFKKRHKKKRFYRWGQAV